MLKQPSFFYSHPSTLPKDALAKCYLSTTFGLNFLKSSVAPIGSSTFYAYLITKVGNRTLGGGEVKALKPKNQSFCNRYSLKKLYIRNKKYEGHNSIHFLKLSSRPIQKLTFGGCCCQSNTNIQHQI